MESNPRPWNDSYIERATEKDSLIHRQAIALARKVAALAQSVDYFLVDFFRDLMRLYAGKTFVLAKDLHTRTLRNSSI